MKITVKQFFSYLVAWFWIEDTIIPYVLQIYKRIPIMGNTYEYIFGVITTLLLFVSSSYWIKKIRIADIVFYMIAVMIVIGTVLVCPQNAVYITEKLYKIVVIGIPMYFIGLAYDHKNTKTILYYVSLLGIMMMLLYQLYRLNLGVTLVEDNMDASYKALPSVMYLLYVMYEQFNTKNFIIAMLGVFLIITYGTRGPILAIILYGLIGGLLKMSKTGSKLKKVVRAIGCIVLCVIFTATDFLTSMIIAMNDMFAKVGFSTRILSMYILGSITDGSGRNNLYSTVIDSINKKPILGHGLMGDRVILGKYVHNIFLELWCDFGVILGTMIIVAMLSVFACAIYKRRYCSDLYFILAMVTMILVKLNLSGSFVNDQYFYLILGICVAACRTKKRGISDENSTYKHVT